MSTFGRRSPDLYTELRAAKIDMDFRFTEIDPKIRYKLLSATVTPRPIAWVSTLDEAGFNAFAEDPATVGFSIRSPEDPKDTGRNIARSGELVVNLVSDDNLEQMNVSAIDFGPRDLARYPNDADCTKDQLICTRRQETLSRSQRRRDISSFRAG
jgi:hypothetical protein